jgi:hypothetical protein
LSKSQLLKKGGIMKNYLRIIPFVILIVIVGCAGSSQYMVKTTPIEGPSPGKALVYFMRPSGIGFAINFQIWDSDHLIGLSQAKSYFAYQCDPGRHLFIGIAENKRGVEADLEAGKSYYIITQVRMGGFRARMAFIPVTRGSEFWDKVEVYKTELNAIAPKEEELEKGEAEKKAKTQQIISFLETAEGSKYVIPLGKEDGR